MKHSTKPRTQQSRTMNRSRATIFAAASFCVALIPTVVGADVAYGVAFALGDRPRGLRGHVRELLCPQGLTVVAHGSIDYRYRTMTRGADNLSYYTEHITSFTDTFTNAGSGKVVTNSGKYTFTAVRVTDNGDGTLTIIYQYAVNTQLADDAGQVVAHDTGLHRYVSVVDHNGTPSDPNDDTELESSDLKTTGLEPDFCAAFVAAIT